MFRVKNKTIPETPQEKSKQIQNNYPTGYNLENLGEHKVGLRLTKYILSSQGPNLCNRITNT